MSSTPVPHKLTEAQLLLLKLFSRNIPEKEMALLRRMLVEFYDNLIQEEIDNLSVSQQDLDNLKSLHPVRTSYQQ